MLFEDRPSPRAPVTRRSLHEERAISFDDGNGMWINAGVLPCGQENSLVTTSCQYKSSEALSLTNTPIYSSLLFRTLLHTPRD
jgi:hypothetical protein